MKTETLKYLGQQIGKTFSDNFSNTGSSLLLSIKGTKAFYMECYSEYANYTGLDVHGNKRVDSVRVPAVGLKTMTVYNLERCIIGLK